jgi:hypothetical protein
MVSVTRVPARTVAVIPRRVGHDRAIEGAAVWALQGGGASTLKLEAAGTVEASGRSGVNLAVRRVTVRTSGVHHGFS